MSSLVRKLDLWYFGEEPQYVPQAGTAMMTGRAEGGPKDGIKLSAPGSWDGVVYPIQRGVKPVTKPYPGKYKWKNQKWVWCPRDAEQDPTSDGGVTGNSI